MRVLCRYSTRALFLCSRVPVPVRFPEVPCRYRRPRMGRTPRMLALLFTLPTWGEHDNSSVVSPSLSRPWDALGLVRSFLPDIQCLDNPGNRLLLLVFDVHGQVAYILFPISRVPEDLRDRVSVNIERGRDGSFARS